MTSRIFQGGTADWYLPASWSPLGVPIAGDILTVGSGTATISLADIASFATLDGETLPGNKTGIPLTDDGATHQIRIVLG